MIAILNKIDDLLAVVSVTYLSFNLIIVDFFFLIAFLTIKVTKINAAKAIPADST